MYIQNLFYLDYWFSQPFTARGPVLWLLIGGFLLFIVAGLIFKILSQYQSGKSSRLILKRAGSLGITMGFLGLLWMFFRQERIVFLAWRFWLLLWLAVVVFGVYRLARYTLKRIPEIKAEEARRANVEKYLPKRN
ncbi:MAG: hypothetical protein AAB797_02325 [Patescibacteria group bacterium]